jgi:hypothetical protein
MPDFSDFNDSPNDNRKWVRNRLASKNMKIDYRDVLQRLPQSVIDVIFLEMARRFDG